MLRIELWPNMANRWVHADFAVLALNDGQGLAKGDVRVFSVGNSEKPAHSLTLPSSLKEMIKNGLAKDIRAMVGNTGCELTFRHRYGCAAKKNIRHILRWAEDAYVATDGKLVLAPMDFDLIHDVMTYGRLLRWAAQRNVPLAIFCGYRFLFEADAFEHIKEVSKRYDFGSFGNPYTYPFREISDAIKTSGAEVWTGVGYAEGLQAGAIDKAEQFGFRGVMTKKKAWETYYDSGRAE